MPPIKKFEIVLLKKREKKGGNIANLAVETAQITIKPGALRHLIIMISQFTVIIKSLVRKVKKRTQSFILEIVLLIREKKGDY